jgi:glycosyltransferase involved in cell wall biosynthesis
MNVRLSVCVLTFNRASTLRETLDSILPQIDGNPSVELFISDNASTDETSSLVADYVTKYSCIRYHRNLQNLGFDGNVAACVEHAAGEYLSFFSDDDIAPAGMFLRVLSELERYKPAILYLNHYPFYDDNLTLRGKPKHAELDRVLENGKEFLLFAGLGFISALTVETQYARLFLANIQPGKGQAHLDLAARIALRCQGPFVFIGTQSVAARASRPSYDSVTFSALNEARFYHSLEAEGLLDAESVKRRVSGSIRHNLMRAVLAKKCLGDHRDLAAQTGLLRETYGHYWQFYLYVYPILLLPRELLLMPYRFVRVLIHHIEFQSHG